MPWSALPEHLNTPEKWNGKDDDDHWYTRWRKQVKGWFAFGPRSTEKWARFREYPKTLAALRGKGDWRVESALDAFMIEVDRLLVIPQARYAYLSRVQYWCDWHVGLQWPLFLHGHYGEWQGYIGFKRDADRVYWLSLYFGKVWK